MDKDTALDIINKSIDDFAKEPLTEQKITLYNEAAEVLGINRNTIIDTFKKYGFENLEAYRESTNEFQQSKLLGALSGMALGTYLAFGFMELSDRKTKPLTFLHNIDDETDHGIIKSRYYMEWKNRHGGDCCGYFYKMYSGESYNEILIKRI